MSLRPNRIGLGIALALHAVALAGLLSYAPARNALLAAAPVMVDLIVPPRAEPPRPAVPQAPRPVAPRAAKPIEAPVLVAPAQAPSPAATPPAAPAAPAPTAERAPAQVSAPIFSADYLDNPAPPYPPMSRRLGEQGRVLLRVLVDAAGRAQEVEVRTSSGSVRLDEAARSTVQRWKFVPARRGADAVAAWVLIPVSFRLES